MDHDGSEARGRSCADRDGSGERAGCCAGRDGSAGRDCCADQGGSAGRAGSEGRVGSAARRASAGRGCCGSRAGSAGRRASAGRGCCARRDGSGERGGCCAGRGGCCAGQDGSAGRDCCVDREESAGRGGSAGCGDSAGRVCDAGPAGSERRDCRAAPPRRVGELGGLRCRAIVLDRIEPPVGRGDRADRAACWMRLINQAAPHARPSGPELHKKHVWSQCVDTCRCVPGYPPAAARMSARNASTSAAEVSKAVIQRTTESLSSHTWKVQSRCRAAMCRGSRRAKTALACTG